MIKPEILVAQAASKFDESGRLVDETTRKMVTKQLLALKELLGG